MSFLILHTKILAQSFDRGGKAFYRAKSSGCGCRPDQNNLCTANPIIGYCMCVICAINMMNEAEKEAELN
ncbi:hypothetical protein C1N53_02665 [Pontibacter sp. SGAir0037]|nr:hypothetical protein C1N53_02665 [Pontibacter sp. SGAir0037]